jgi:hypothetical protein
MSLMHASSYSSFLISHLHDLHALASIHRELGEAGLNAYLESKTMVVAM